MALTVKRPERTVVVSLDGSLTARWEQLHRQVEDKLAERESLEKALKGQPVDDGPNRRSPERQRVAALGAEIVELSKELGEVSEQAAAASATFTLRGLPRDVWDGLVTRHPARPALEDGTLPDRHFPFHTVQIVAAALREPGTIAGVALADGTEEPFTSADWPAFETQMTASQFDDFREAVITLNAGENTVPFFRASASIRASGRS